MNVILSKEDYQYIGARYTDCLCINCLNEIKTERLCAESTFTTFKA
jgi:hypothetical protein